MADIETPVGKMDALRAQLVLLKDFIEESTTDCRIFKIDQYDQNDRVPDIIEPVAVRGLAALPLAQTGLTDLSRPKGMNVTNVTRTPGVIVVDKDLSTIVSRINKQKDDLKKLIKDTYPDARERRNFTNEQFRGRVMLQVYRHIYTNQRTKQKPPVTRIPERIRFTWSPYTLTSTPLKKKQARLHVLMSKEKTKDAATMNLLDMTLAYLDVCPATSMFTIRKPRAPFPKANIYYGKNDVVDVPAHVPLVIYTDTEIDIEDIPTYDKSNRKTKRNTALNTVTICNPLNLHQIIQ